MPDHSSSNQPASAVPSDGLFRAFAETIPTLAWIANADGYITWYNRRWHDYCGTTPAEMEGWGWQSVHDPEVLPAVLEKWQAAIAAGRDFAMTFPLRGADGQFRPFLTRASCSRDSEGEVAHWFGTNIDVSDRIATEKRNVFLMGLTDNLRELGDPDEIMRVITERVGLFLDVSICAYADMDADEDGFTIRGDWTAPASPSIVGHYQLADFGKLAVTRLSAREPLVINDNLLELEPEEAASFRNIGIAATICMPLVKNGRLTALMAIHDKNPRQWTEDELALIGEVTERAWAHVERVGIEADLRASEEQFRVFAQTIPNQLWAARANGDLYWFNRQVVDYSGQPHDRLSGSGWTSLVHADDIERAGAAWAHSVETGTIYEVEFRIRRLDGEYRWFLVRAEPTRDAAGQVNGWVGTNTDIEEQRRQAEQLEAFTASLETQVAERTAELMSAEEALRQSQKMEAVGQLTGGIAHDFNNLLTAISGGLEMIALRIGQGRVEGLERYTTAALNASKRAAALTHRLLAFSRRQTLDPRPTDINRLINGMEDLIGRTIGPGIALEVVGAGGLWPTLVDQNQLENALLNLVINARDAMPEGGRLTIETANRWLDPRAARERDLRPGQYVSLCVSDSGTGMAPDVIAKAFDPFFTTKPLGVGTGLGLSMIYGFVRQSGGQVRIYSDEGSGTTVCLYLPRFGGSVDEDDEVAAIAAVPRAGEGETVLVVDDEAGIRMLVTDILEELGYRSLEAEDGREGLDILQSDARIDLLITDVGLPGGMNGRQMADAARRSRPDLKILFITGYAENAVIGNGQLDPGMHVMTKPFELDSLGRRIKELIEE